MDKWVKIKIGANMNFILKTLNETSKNIWGTEGS